MSDPVFAVLVDGADKLDLKAVGQILSWFRREPIQDAQRRARHCWGITADDLDRDGAEALRARLVEAGVPAFTLPTDLIAALPPAKPAARGRLEGGAAVFELRDGATEAVSPARVEAVAAAGFEAVETQKVSTTEGPTPEQQAMNLGVMAATGLPIKLGTQKRRVEKTVETHDLVFYLDVVLKEPAARVRVDAQKFDYSMLGAKKQYNVLANIRTLTAELAALAPSAQRGRGTRVLLESRPIKEMGYTGLADLERETRWLLTLARRGGG